MMDDEQETHDVELMELEVENPQATKEENMLDYILSMKHKGPVIQPQGGLILLKAVIFACKAVVACEKQLNIMGEERDDGNYGVALAHIATTIIFAVEEDRISATIPSIAFAQISKIIKEEAGDFLEGKIYALFFDYTAETFCRFREDEQLTESIWLAVLSRANEIKRLKESEIPSGTMLDTLVCAENKLKCVLGLQSICAFEAVVNEVETFTWQTAHMPEPCLASSVNQKAYKYPDPGIYAACVWLRAAYQAFKLFLDYNK